MKKRKEIPVGILFFIALVIVVDVSYIVSITYSLLSSNGHLSMFPSFSILSIMTWSNLFFTALSLMLIPYGFMKRKKWARFLALLLFSWSLFGAITPMLITGEKIIPFLLFGIYLLLIMYLLMSPVKTYFEKISNATTPSETTEHYTHGIYTLYSKLVRLKNGKTQLIYFFCKSQPKSGTPASIPYGFEVTVSKRSGMPYLKKR